MRLDQFLAILPMAPQKWHAILETAMAEWRINNWVRQAAFLAQIGHESGQCNRLVENLHYRSAVQIQRTFPTRVKTIDAARDLVMQPEALANTVYSNRYGNGPPESGDGYRYRGRGLIQVTFKDNYYACGKALKLDLVAQPELLEQEDVAARSACWYWNSRGLSAVADAGGDLNFERITKAINPAMHGQTERRKLWIKAMEVLR
jgi:putative chitinase